MKNTVSLIGRIGDDPILKSLENGKKVVNISLATSQKWRNDKNELVERTEWHRLVIWGKSAEIASEYVKKGHKVAIEGSIQYRTYTDKEGIKHYATDILVDEFFLLEPKPANQ